MGSNMENKELKINQIEQNEEENKHIIFNDKNFRKFNEKYKYKKASVITRISNYKSLNLCFKETMITSSDQLQRCINECIALRTFYNAYNKESSTENIVYLHVNKKKESKSYPKRARLVMKYCDGEDLDDYLIDEDDGEVGFLYEDDFRSIIKKILIQLNICHNAGILHCDLKPHNIRVNEQSDKFDEDHPEYHAVNIIDFGFCHIFKDKRQSQKDVKLSFIKGTPGFIAPETIKNKKYSIKSDIFSLGCLAFFLLTNKKAVIQTQEMNKEEMIPNRKRLKRLIKRENDRNRDDESRINQDTIDFVMSLLWKNPTKRPTAEEALKNK